VGAAPAEPRTDSPESGVTETPDEIAVC